MDLTEAKNALLHPDPSRAYPVAVRGEGIYLYDNTGKRYIDGISGAGNVTLGHGRKRIAEAMADQAGSLAYCFSAFFTNHPALDLAARTAALAPADLNHVYFVSGGSEGMETAFKIAPYYPYRCDLAGCDGVCNLACAHQLEAAILQAGPENVAAFVAEPVVLGGIAVGGCHPRVIMRKYAKSVTATRCSSSPIRSSRVSAERAVILPSSTGA